MIHSGNGVLPDELLRRNLRTEITRARAHVAVNQLEPRPGKRIGKLIGILHEPPRDLFVRRIEPQRQVGGQHRRHAFLRRIVRIGNRRAGPLRDPLVCASRALSKFPLVAKQVPEKVGAPLGGSGGPGDLQSARDRVATLACAEAVLPAETLFFETGGFRLGSDIRCRSGTVGLTERVTTRDECNGLLVIHGHAGEGLADIDGRFDRIGIAVGAFGVDVDEAHLHCGQGVFESATMHVAIGFVFTDKHRADLGDTL